MRIPKADMAAQARALLRTRRSAALATALATDNGRPYVSLVTIACDVDGSPILLLSGLSDHTRNLAAEPRASLLFEDASRRANPQTGPRLTLIGSIAQDDAARLRRRFLARHPRAALYADFADFAIFRMTVERGHWVGGFGQARWIAADDLLADPDLSRAVAEAEPEILAAVNAAHAEALQGAVRQRGRGGSGWRLLALDPHGCDVARGDTTFVRLTLPRAASDTASLLAMLAEPLQG